MNSEPARHRFDLTGRVAIVTGGTGHLGRAMCSALADARATVLVTSRNAGRAQELAQTLASPAGQVHCGLAMDHMLESSIDTAFRMAAEHAGRVDILVNNAHEPTTRDWTTISGDEFTRQLANATGYFLLARHLRNHAVEHNRSASVIMLGSMYGQVASYPETYQGHGPASPVAYQSLKGAVLQMTRHLAVYWAQDRVRVNSLSPGPFPAASAAAAFQSALAAKTPMGRVGMPNELTGALLLLASDAGSYITGHDIVIDGGWTAW